MSRRRVLLLFAVACSNIALQANINFAHPDSRLTFTDAAGRGKLQLNTDLGASGGPYFNGTLQVDDDYMQRRIQGGTLNYIYMKRANIITGTGRAEVSARYESIASGADQGDKLTLMDTTNNLRYAHFSSGQVVHSLEIGAGANEIGSVYLSGAPIFHNPIVINTGLNNPTIIHWALTGKLNQSIELPDDSGQTYTNQFVLEQDLRLGDGVVFSPGQTAGDFPQHPANSPELLISFSNSKLALGGQDLTWRSTVYFEKAGDIELNANLKLDSTWIFSGNAMIQGNGNWIDLRGTDADNTGTIAIDRGTLVGNSNTTTLYFRDVKLRLRNGALQTHERTVLDLSNVEIELEHTVNFTSGNIHISGPTMIYAKNYTFSVSHAATMTVDGTVLYFDTGDFFNNTAGVYPKNSTEDDYDAQDNLNFQSNGYIAQVTRDDNVTWEINDSDAESGSGTKASPYKITNTKNRWLSNDVQIKFLNILPASEDIYHFDGDNYIIHFAREANCIVLENDATVYFTNVVFKDFDPTAFTLNSGGSGSNVYFGQGCVLELAQDVELGESGDTLYTLTFRLETGDSSPSAGTPGNENKVKVNGYGHALLLPYASGQSTPGQIELDDDYTDNGIQVEFENIKIDRLGGWPAKFTNDFNRPQIYTLQHTNTLLLRNARVNMSNSYSYSCGNMVVDGIVRFETQHNTDQGNPDNVFTYQPMREATLTISHNSQLQFGPKMTFSLDAIRTGTTLEGMVFFGGYVDGDISQTGKVQYEQPDRALRMIDNSSVLLLDGATLHVTATGLTFSFGAVDIKNDSVWFVGDEQHGGGLQQIIVSAGTSDATTLNIMGGAMLDVRGPVYYTQGI